MTTWKLLLALAASVIVSIPAAMLSITVAAGSTDELLLLPEFWYFYGQALIGFLLASFAASILTMLFTNRLAPRK